MWTLARPVHTARAAFAICVGSVRDPLLRVRLQSVIETVVDRSAAFDAAGRRQALHEIVSEAIVGGNVTADEMGTVYTQRMAKKRAPGRRIYEDIISASPQGRCPLCAQRSVTTLDHHLPKAWYPALAVAPLNLVPSCSDCNKAKLDRFPRLASDVSLHPYFDDIDGERWLMAEVVETQPAAVRFLVIIPRDWDHILGQRVRNHFKALGLATLYGSEAAEELFNIRQQMINLYDVAGMNAVRAHLEDRALSCELARRNGWRTATYRAWADSDWFCNGGFAPAY